MALAIRMIRDSKFLEAYAPASAPESEIPLRRADHLIVDRAFFLLFEKASAGPAPS
jgi:hypothetical protein